MQDTDKHGRVAHSRSHTLLTLLVYCVNTRHAFM